MNPLNLIPDKYLLLVKLVAIALAVVLVLVWWNSHNRTQQRIGYDRAIGEVREAQAKADAAQRIRELNNFRRMENAYAAAEKLQAERDAARAAVRVADRRLRDTLDDFDRRIDGATREAAIAAARTLRGVFDACVTEYRDVADAADGHLADARLCRAAWPE